MQDHLVYLAVCLLAFAVLGILVVIALERLFKSRVRKPQSFLDVIKRGKFGAR